MCHYAHCERPVNHVLVGWLTGLVTLTLKMKAACSSKTMFVNRRVHGVTTLKTAVTAMKTSIPSTDQKCCQYLHTLSVDVFLLHNVQFCQQNLPTFIQYHIFHTCICGASGH
jgi:hypothetical protein